jgi:ribonucleoside-diphosphate reductase alpha chain
VSEINKKDPYEGINFVKRNSNIRNIKGEKIFEEEVEFPDYFTDESVSIVSDKYLCNNSKKKEKSLKELINRVSDTIAIWGKEDKYFSTDEEKEDFNYKLKYFQVHQYFAFNSPVYFNLGLHNKPTSSACFILDIEDDLDSISEITKIETKIFKGGSGSGMNLSKLRSCKEKLSSGGYASGPVSFLKVQDINASEIRSGGALRRSAKMACLDINHPDIIDFITCKKREEKKLQILRSAGLEKKSGKELSDEVFFQNTNISVMLTDKFMESVISDNGWETKYVTTGEISEKFKARELLMKIAELAHETADPGVMYYDNINKWNTCLNDGEIKTSNPCGEFLHISAYGGAACNLASINLKKFIKKNNKEFIFDLETFKDVIRTVITAQDILIDRSAFPTKEIARTSHEYRPLGLGFSNLGATLMYLGLPYDSNAGRNFASLVTALLTGTAYEMSNDLAKIREPFKKFDDNASSFYKVLRQHFDALTDIQADTENSNNILNKLYKSATEQWNKIINLVNKGEKFRNDSCSMAAPTGTISFLMSCDTTGIEPDYSLVKYKVLSAMDGATIKLVNNTVIESLQNLGYSKVDIDMIINSLKKEGHLENSILKKEHLPIFDCASSCGAGKRFISHMGHIKMMAEVQPFLSGAISKTVNLQKDATVQQIYDLYVDAWRLNLKGLTVYRDGSKTFQPLDNIKKEEKSTPPIHKKKELPNDRAAIIHKFNVGSCKGYLTCGLLEDNSLGEIFLTYPKKVRHCLG